MAKSRGQFHYDGIVFHGEDEMDSAEKFCEELREIDMGNGRRLNVVTIEQYSIPGRPLIEILNSAISEAEYVYFSSSYYATDPHGNFYGHVANHSKIPHKFIVLQTGADCPSLPNVDAACKLRLETDWSITKFAPGKIRQLYTGRSSTPESEQENQHIEMPDDSLLTVMNPSISSTSDFQSLVDTSTAETCPKRLQTTPHGVAQDHSRCDTAGHVTDVSSLTDTDLFTDAELLGEQEEEVQEVLVNRMAPQRRPAARSSEDGFNSHGNISMAADGATNDRSPPDGSETYTSVPEITEEQREQLRDYC